MNLFNLKVLVVQYITVVKIARSLIELSYI